MIQSLNSFLAHLFTQGIRTSPDIPSLHKRNQALSVIYVNFFLGLCIVIWTIFGLLGFPVYTLGIIISITPLWILSFIFLKKGHTERAMICILVYMHLEIIVTHKVSEMVLSSIVSIMICPPTAALLALPYKVQGINAGLCLIQLLSIFAESMELFKVTLTETQSAQLFQLYLAAFLLCAYLGFVSFIQQDTGVYLWRLAQSNYERADKISKEVMQAIEAKDTFVSSLSHEIRNPLNALKGSIDYLLKVVDNPTHLEILENAHISSEVLLNLVNNVLDAAKLKSEKMEIAHTETSLVDLIKKVAMIHYDRLREKEISSRVYLDKNLPSTIWTDSSRLLQIIMNLMSNAIKFTPNRGRVQIYLSWCSSESNKESLLVPIEDSIDARSESNGKDSEHSKLLGKKALNEEDDGNDENHFRCLSFDFPEVEEFDLAEIESPTLKMKLSTPSQNKNLKGLNLKEIKLNNQFIVWNVNSVSGINMKQLIDVYSQLLEQSNEIEAKGYLKVQVSDTGCGIKKEHQPKMFEMFSQATKNVASIYGGSGLGLWLCKQLCLKMGGDIVLKSQANDGTTFVFYVPVKNDAGEEVLSHDLQFYRREVRGLVVDDYSYNREIHKLLLEREGVYVDIACDGKEALEKYMSQGNCYYDFIMMDVQMPVMDGFTAAKKIREWEGQKNWMKANIYFVSGEYYNEEEIMIQLRTKGHMSETTGVRCLRKPVDIEIIRNIVEKHIRRRKGSMNSSQSSSRKSFVSTRKSSKKSD